uniref:Uncharacterized protein n=1 Tax=Glossina brevipalpis TaxID=37001 RepID=A0A1A9W2Z4_9MUSC
MKQLIVLRTNMLRPIFNRTYATLGRQPSHVRIVEVGPRDGLQNEKKLLPADYTIGAWRVEVKQHSD